MISTSRLASLPYQYVRSFSAPYYRGPSRDPLGHGRGSAAREDRQVEEAFRVTKHDLKVRPIFHWKPRRVKAHIAIAFTAYSLVRYLEYRVKLQYIKLSPEEIRRNLIGVQTSILYDKSKKIRYGLPSRMSKHARKIYGILEVTRRCTPYIIEKCSALISGIRI